MRSLSPGRVPLLLMIPVVLLGCTPKPELIEKKCSTCHKTSVVYAKKRTVQEWERVLYGMKARGLKVTPEEEKAILEILAKDYSRQ